MIILLNNASHVGIVKPIAVPISKIAAAITAATAANIAVPTAIAGLARAEKNPAIASPIPLNSVLIGSRIAPITDDRISNS